MTPTVTYKPAGDYSSAEILDIQEYRRATLDYWTVNPATAKGHDRGGAYGAITYGRQNNWREPTQADRVLVSKFEEQRADLFKPKKSFLDRVSGAVDVAIQAVVIGGITGGVAAGFGVGVGPFAGSAPAAPAGGTGTYSGMALGGGSGPVGAKVALTGSGLAGTPAATSVTAAAAGTVKGASYASLVKPVLSLGTAAIGLAGQVKAIKGMGMSADVGLPAYADQLTPTTAAGIVNGATAAPEDKSALWIGAALVVAAILTLGGK